MVDISTLPPEEAVSKLLEQNRALGGQNQAFNAHVKKLKQVQEDNFALRDEVAALRKQLDEKAEQQRAATAKHRASLERLQAMCETMAKEVEGARELGAANAKLRADLDNLRFRLIMQNAGDVPADTAAQIEELKASLQAAARGGEPQAAGEAASGRVAELEGELARVEGDKAALTASVAEARAQVAELERDVAALRELRGSAEEAAQSGSAETAAARAELAQLKQELERAGEAHAVEVRRVREEGEAAGRTALDEANKRAGDLEAALRIATGDCADARHRADELRVELEAANERAALGDARIAELQASVEHIVETQTALDDERRRQVKALESSVAQLESRTAALFSEKEALEGDKAALEGAKLALEADKAALEGQMAILVGEKAALEGEKAALEGEKAALEGEKAGLEGEKAALEQELAARHAESPASTSGAVGLPADGLDRADFARGLDLAGALNESVRIEDRNLVTSLSMHSNPIFFASNPPSPDRLDLPSNPPGRDVVNGHANADGAAACTGPPHDVFAAVHSLGQQVEEVLGVQHCAAGRRDVVKGLQGLLKALAARESASAHSPDESAIDAPADLAHDLINTPRGSASSQPLSPQYSNIDGLHRVIASLTKLQKAVTDSAERWAESGDATSAQASSLLQQIDALKRGMDVAMRELQTYQDANAQLQEELTIQWQEKQQALQAHAEQGKRLDVLQAKLQDLQDVETSLEEAHAANEELQARNLLLEQALAAAGDAPPPLRPHGASELGDEDGLTTARSSFAQDSGAVGAPSTALPALDPSPSAAAAQLSEEQAAHEAADANRSETGPSTTGQDSTDAALQATLAERDTLRGALAEAQSERDEALGRAEEADRQLQDLAARVADAESRAADANAACAAATARLHDAEARAQAADELLAAAQERAQAAEAAESDAAGGAAASAQAVEQARREVEEAEARAAAAEAARDDSDARAMAAEAAALQAGQEAQEALRRAEVAEGKLTEAEEGLRAAAERCERAEAIVAEAKDELDRAEASVAAAEEAARVANERADRAEARSVEDGSSLQEELQRATEALAQQRAQAEAAMAEQRAALKNMQAEMQVMSSQASAARQELAAKERALLDALDACDGLEARLEAATAEAERERDQAAEAAASFTARLERLQKLQKERRTEMEHIQAQYSTAKAALQKAEAEVARLSSNLAAESARCATLSAALGEASASVAKLNQINTAVSKARRSGVDDSDLSPMAKLNDMMTAAQKADQLEARVTALSKDAEALAQLRVELEAVKARAEAAEASRDRFQKELMDAIADTANYQDQVEVLKADVLRLQKQSQKERNRYDSTLQHQHVELQALAGLKREQWPAAVRSLVEKHEEAATAAANARAAEGVRTAVEDLQLQLARAKDAADDAAAAQAAAAGALDASEARVQQLQVELREQEATLSERVTLLEEQLEDFRRFVGASSPRAVSVAMSELSEVKQALQERTEKYAAIKAELAATRERAMEIMQDKDEEIQALTARLKRRRSRKSGDDDNDDEGMASEDATPQHADDADRVSMSNEEYWKMRFQEAQEGLTAAEAELRHVQALLEDEQRTHQLRDVADAVRKEEMEEVLASCQRSTVDVEYLKNVLVGFFESGELPANATVIMVLSRLLKFSERDQARLRKGTAKEAAAASSLFSFGSVRR